MESIKHSDVLRHCFTSYVGYAGTVSELESMAPLQSGH